MSTAAAYQVPTTQPVYPSRRVRTVANSDVMMVHAADGGDLVYDAGVLVMDNGIFNAVYLSLFGGNSDDGGQSATEDRQWWGNVLAENDRQKMTSEYQYVMRTIACTPANLRKLDAAGNRDLATLVESALCTEASVSTRIVGANMVAATVNVVIDGTRHEYNISQSWGL